MKAWLLALAILLAAPAAAETVLTTSRSYPTGGVRDIRIDFPAGGLEITPTDAEEISVTMTATCRGGSHCQERAEKIRLISDIQGGTLSFKLEGPRRKCVTGPVVHLEFHVPRSMDVAIEMGAGDLDIGTLAGNVAVQMGAGDIDIRSREQSFGSVNLDVGVGEAHLRRSSRSVEGKGFLSKRLHWDDGAGSGRIDVDLGVGDVDVRLD
jgi:hypothetical protein